MTEGNKVFNVKAVIDKEKDRVVFVESDHDFVDVVLSFLTLPIGTVIRLIQKDENIAESSSTLFRCIKNLYSSVQNLEAHYLNTEECKSMLLFPPRHSESLCLNLKLHINDREPTTAYVCRAHYDSISYSNNERSQPCGCDPSRRYRRLLSKSELSDGTAVFAKPGRYIITDDMHVKKCSTDTCLSVLGMKGITDWNRFEERNAELGLKEVLLLLKHSLYSNSPLTNLILENDEPTDRVIKSKHDETTQHPNGTSSTSEVTSKISVKLVIRKSNDELLYAIAGEDFVDFLFNFLTFPLGFVIKLCGGSSPMFCLDNLYKSVGDLSSTDQITSKMCEAYLIHPRIAQHSGCKKNQLLFGKESEKEDYFTGGTKRMKPTIGGAYVKCPSTFMVTNDLVVTPSCFTSGLFLLKRLNVSSDDVEERDASIGKQEALNLLRASLFSDAVLSSIIYPKQNSSRTPKKEVVD